MPVIEIEDRRDRNQIHVGFVVGFQRAHVSPVERFLLVFVDKVEGIHAVVAEHPGQNVVAESRDWNGSSASFSSTGMSTSVLNI
jgi:hypothetical protein